MYTVGPPHMKIPFCSLTYCLKMWLVESVDVKSGDMRADFIEKGSWVNEYTKFKPMLFRVKTIILDKYQKKIEESFLSWVISITQLDDCSFAFFYCCNLYILCRITYLYLKLLYPLDKSVLYYAMSLKVNIFVWY